MNLTFAETVEQLNLQPGQSQRVRVSDYEVKIRRLPVEDSTTAELVMLQPWVWFPDPKPMATLPVQRGTQPLPDPPVIPDDEE